MPEGTRFDCRKRSSRCPSVEISNRPMSVSQSITKKSASNLAIAFVLLPKDRADAMSRLYAFCRQVDDVADEATRPVHDRRQELARWRSDLRGLYEGVRASIPVVVELEPVIRAHKLTLGLFEEILQGVEMDLDVTRYPTYEELDAYCYRVASAVGLQSIEIFGYSNPACRDYAVHLGKALQLTNILRDVRNDAERGHIYIPLAELARYQVSEQDILNLRYSEKFQALAGSLAARARSFYRKARESLPASDRRSMIAAELMGSVYWDLLCQLERRRFDVFRNERIQVSKPRKLFLILRTWLRLRLGFETPHYGV